MTSIAMRKAFSRTERINAGEWLVWATVLLLLGAGFLLRHSIEGRTITFSEAGVKLDYPASWMPVADRGEFEVFHAIDPASSVQFPTSVRVQQIPLGELGQMSGSLGDVALAWSTRQGQQMPIYSVLQIMPTHVHGQIAIAVDYAYVADPVVGSAAGSIPTVVRAHDVLLQQGETITVVSFEASTDIYPQELEHWEKILASLEVA